MTVRSILCLLVLGVAPTAAADDMQVRQEGFLAAQVRALQAKDFRAALDVTDRALSAALRPQTRALLLSNACLAHLYRNALARAEAACDRALGEDPRAWQALLNRGNVHFARGAFDAALADFAAADRLRPDNAAIRESLAIAKAHLNRQIAAN